MKRALFALVIAVCLGYGFSAIAAGARTSEPIQPIEAAKVTDAAKVELGKQLLERVEKDLEELGAVEQYPKMEGRQMVMVIAPKKK